MATEAAPATEEAAATATTPKEEGEGEEEKPQETPPTEEAAEATAQQQQAPPLLAPEPVRGRSATPTSPSPGIDDDSTPLPSTVAASAAAPALSSDTLEDMCYAVLVEHFPKSPDLVSGKAVPKRVLERLYSLLQPQAVPLAVASKHIGGAAGEAFWRRFALSQWPHSDTRRHGRSWKRLFFETACTRALERFGVAAESSRGGGDDDDDDDAPLTQEKLEALLLASRDHVLTLRLTQLHSHISPALVLNMVPNLATLSIAYGTRKVGTGLDWAAIPGMNLTDAEHMARAVRASGSLTTLLLPGNAIGDELAAVLAPGLADNRTLTCLDLSHNHLSAKGAALLIDAVLGESASGSVVVQLSLADNLLGPEAGSSLSRLLSTCESLERLDVGMNALGEAAPGVLEAATESCSLTHLRLASCSVGKEQSAAFGAALAALVGVRCPGTLESVDVNNNEIGDETASALAPAISKLKPHSTALTAINVRGCGIGTETSAAIEASLEKLREARRKAILEKSKH